jgi:hypothetical protein
VNIRRRLVTGLVKGLVTTAFAAACGLIATGAAATTIDFTSARTNPPARHAESSPTFASADGAEGANVHLDDAVAGQVPESAILLIFGAALAIGSRQLRRRVRLSGY